MALLVAVVWVGSGSPAVAQTATLVEYDFENLAPNQGVLVTAPPSFVNSALVASASNFSVEEGARPAFRLNTPNRDGVVPRAPGNQMSFQQGVTFPANLPVTAYNFFQFSLKLKLCGPGTISSVSFDVGHNVTPLVAKQGIVEYRTAAAGTIIGFNTFPIPNSPGFVLNPQSVAPNLTVGNGQEIFFRIRLNTQATDANRLTGQLRIDNVEVRGECTMDIDIKPGSDPNSINTKSKGKIPVAILGKSIDVTTIDQSTVRFGPTGSEAAPVKTKKSFDDIDGDGKPDLVLQFATQDAGFSTTDTEGMLTGMTTNGTPIKGSDSVRIVK